MPLVPNVSRIDDALPASDPASKVRATTRRDGSPRRTAIAGPIVDGVVVAMPGVDVVVTALVEVVLVEVIVVVVVDVDVDVAEELDVVNNVHEVVVDAPVSTLRSSRRAMRVVTSAMATSPSTLTSTA
jgi:hypothetical protein